MISLEKMPVRRPSPEANAMPFVVCGLRNGSPPPVKIIQISGSVSYDNAYRIHRLYRLWSDGTIEYKDQQCGPPLSKSWCGWRVVPE